METIFGEGLGEAAPELIMEDLDAWREKAS